MIHIKGVSEPRTKPVLSNNGALLQTSAQVNSNTSQNSEAKIVSTEKFDFFTSLIEWAKKSNTGKGVLSSIALVGLFADNLASRVLNIDIGFKKKIEDLHNKYIFQANHTDYFPPPTKEKVGYFEEVLIPLPDINSSYDQIQLNSSQSQEPTLHGYYFPSPNTELTMIYLHGYNGSADECYKDCLLIKKYITANMLIIDYRGFGKSKGEPSREGVVKDVIAAYKYLEEVKNIKGNSIVLFGSSLGGAISLEAAHRLAQMNKSLGGVTVLYPFSSIKDITSWRFSHIPKFLVLNDLLNSERLVRKLNIPIFIAHGTADIATPLEQSLKIFKKANQPKGFYLINGIGHDDICIAQQETILEYAKALRSFIEKNILQKQLT